MVVQIMGKHSNSVSKFLPIIMLRHNFKKDNNPNMYKSFANKQIDIVYYIAINS